MASSCVDEKIKELLREAEIKPSARNIVKVARILDAIQRDHKHKHQIPPGHLDTLTAYSVSLEETGHAPWRPDKYDGINLSSNFLLKVRNKYSGRSETTVTVTKGSFELKLTVVITYETRIDNYKVSFNNINLEVNSSYTGINQDPLRKVIFETCSYYEDFARQSIFTCGEYNIEKEVLHQLIPDPPSAKRARTE